jgi:tetratricopeptide (TPR) repeat protein
MIENNQLSELNHETYGWIIYRYIKAEENNLTSIQVRTFLRDYMNLKNERPSMLHSMILNFALNYSKTHSDFNFYNFFVLWNPENLRSEDLQDGYKDGHNIPSLISRICRELSNSNAVADLDKDIISKISLNREIVLDFFREPYFWKLFNAHKENRLNDLWQMFDKYNKTYSQYGKSKWHSEILKIAERFMKENESWQFLSLFKEWNPNNFMDADWKEEKGKDGETYKPLAIKAIKKVFDIIKNQPNKNVDDVPWLIESYEKAIKLFPDDEWLIREKALLHIWQKDFEAAKNIYRQLVLELADKFYIWQEFSECIENDNQLKIGMLSKALSLEKNEDFLGEIHLKLARVLIDENLLENALVELEMYKNIESKRVGNLRLNLTVYTIRQIL